MNEIYFRSENNKSIFVKGWGTVKPHQRFKLDELLLTHPVGLNDDRYPNHSNTPEEIKKYGFAWFPVAGDCPLFIGMKRVILKEIEI